MNWRRLIVLPSAWYRASYRSNWEIGSGSLFPLWVDTVEKVVSDPPKRNNRIRTARYLNRNCVRGRDFESMLRIQGRKIVFQQYRSKADILACAGYIRSHGVQRTVRLTPQIQSRESALCSQRISGTSSSPTS